MKTVNNNKLDKKKKSYDIWLETAYQLFAEKGPEHLSIKELSKQCQLPRTNFYYYFENKNDLINEIIKLHFRTSAVRFIHELQTRLNTFIPDFYSILYDFKLELQFAKTLFNHRDKDKFNEAHKIGVEILAEFVVPKFKVYFNIHLPDDQAKEFWFTLTDAWYSRLKFDDFSTDYLYNLSNEIMDTMLPLIKQSNSKDSVNPSFDTPV